MKSFKEHIEEHAAKCRELGYDPMDLDNEKKKMVQERRDWVLYFDRYIELQLAEDGTYDVRQVIDRAKKLADLRLTVIGEKFPEGVDVDG